MDNDKEKPKTTALHMQRGFVADQGDGVFYREKRGLHTFEIGAHEPAKPKELKDMGAPAKSLFFWKLAEKVLPNVDKTTILQVFTEGVDGANDPATAENIAALQWYGRVAARQGKLSVHANLSLYQGRVMSLMLAFYRMIQAADPAKPDEESLKEARDYMDRISHLCETWHLLHMDLMGEHELAFAKLQHKAGAAKGTQAVQDKKERRNAIVREQVRLLPPSDRPRNPSEIARRIRVQTLAAFKAAGLSDNYTDATFDTIVRRALG